MPQIVYSVVEKDSNMIWKDYTLLWIWYGGNVSTRAKELREAAARSTARCSAPARHWQMSRVLVWNLSACMCLGSEPEFHCWKAKAGLSPWFKLTVVSFSAGSTLTAHVLMICFLCFQTVAEIAKELEKNEKIRVQLEVNKTGESVS